MIIVKSTSYPRTSQDQVLRRPKDASGLSAGTDLHLRHCQAMYDAALTFSRCR
jgi:hypothetical protein